MAGDTVTAPSRPGRRLVLLDADGVVQVPARGFAVALHEVVGEAASPWLRDTFRADGSVLTGQQETLPLLANFLRECGVVDAADALYERLWYDIVVHDDVLELVQVARRAGSLVYLATNQDFGRARHMRTALGYDHRLDGQYYSCELGVAKPDPRYFERIMSDLKADPSEVIFIDDVAENVAAARDMGIRANRWEYGNDSINDLASLLLPRAPVDPVGIVEVG